MDGFNFTPSSTWSQTAQFLPQGPGLESAEVSSARQQMVSDLQRATDALRNAANSFENFSRILSRTSNTTVAQTNGRANEIANFLQNHGHLLQPAPAGTGGSPVLAPQASTGTQAAPVASARSPSVAPDDAEGQAKKISKRQKKLMKQARDPDAPKRPPSAYLLFQNEVRADMKERFPELAYRDLLGKVADAWKGLSEEDKKVYEDKTLEAMKKWGDDKKNHEAGQTTVRASSASSDEINSSSYTLPQPVPQTPVAAKATSPDVSVTKEKKDKKRKDKDKEGASAKKEKRAKQ